MQKNRTRNKKILDACCGGRMFWENKQNPNVVFMDIREHEGTLCDGRIFKVKPDIIADFKNIPFPDNYFYHVVFDPPHLLNVGEKSYLATKYGKLNKDNWQSEIMCGFKECMRVLKPNCILTFKWSCRDISYSEIIKITGRPLYKSINNRTYFLNFMKGIN